MLCCFIYVFFIVAGVVYIYHGSFIHYEIADYAPEVRRHLIPIADWGRI